MAFEPRPGGCECGAVRYRLVAAPLVLYVCHCTDCQTATGSGFALSLLLPEGGLRVEQGETVLHEYPLPGDRLRRRHACPACGVALWVVPRRFSQLTNLQPGSLDDTAWLRPVAHIWTRSAQPWLAIPEDVRRFEAQPTNEEMRELVRAYRAREG